ncbi:MAG: IS110 family transposase [Methylococcales bacterium]
MSHYCGIDLHSNNHVVVVIDQEGKRVYEKRLRNDLNLTLQALIPYHKTLQGVAVESTFTGTGWSTVCRKPGFRSNWSTRPRSNNTRQLEIQR